MTGTVLDAASNCVAGAVVEAYQYDRHASDDNKLEKRDQTTTATNGAFEFRLSPKATWLLARKPGLAFAWRQTGGARTPTSDVRLVMARPSVLAGVVVDEADKLVAGAEVCASMAFAEMIDEGGRRTFAYLDGTLARECFQTRTGPDGRFRIEAFPTNATAALAVKSPGKALRQTGGQSHSGPNLPFRGGQEDIHLVVEPAGAIEGNITAESAEPPLPAARLSLLPDGPSFGMGGVPPQSAPDGTFRITDVAAGSYRLRASFSTNPFTAPDWIAEAVPVSVQSGQTNRAVKITALRGGLLEVSTVAKTDRKPLGDVGVAANHENDWQAATSTTNGLALLRLLPGEYQVSAHKEGWRPAEESTATVEAGKTNRLQMELSPPPRITGTVRRPDGQPAAKLSVRIVGDYSSNDAKIQTDENGKLDFEWGLNRYRGNNATPCLFIQDPERNLAVVEDLDEDAGPLDLKLEPGLTIVGRVECDGKPLTNAGAALVFWTGNSGMHIYGLTTATNTPGHFEIPALPTGRKYGVYASAVGYGQKYVSEIDTSEAKRVELEPVELRPANLTLAGKVVDADDKPVVGVYVNLNGEGQPFANSRTDRDGRFSFDHVCEGQVRLYASGNNSSGNLSAEVGDTNVVLRLGESSSSGSASSTPRKLKGIVTDPAGQPVASAQVSVFPAGSSRSTKTATNGAYSLAWTVESWQAQYGNLLVIRDPAHGLALAEEVSDDATNLDVCLQPAVSATGRVEDPKGVPLTNAQMRVFLLTGSMSSQFGDQSVSTGAQGRYEIKGLPAGAQFYVYASAKGYGRSSEKLQADSETNRVELPTFALKLADQVLSGQVLSSADKPLAGVNVNLSGDDQPEGSATTDKNGRFAFKVCEGQVRLYANSQSSYANITADAGDTNVVLQLRDNSSSRRTAQRASLSGKPLPDLAPLSLAADAIPAGKPLLLCLFDFEQRPSRRCLRLLAEQHEALKQKGLALLAIQAAPATAESLKAWQDANPLPFPVGRVAAKADQAKWVSNTEAMPWLILTDAKRRVTAEGFPLDELEAKLKDLKQ